MKKITLAISFLICVSSFAQDSDTINVTDSLYIALMNHSPKGLESDLTLRPDNRFLKEKLNTIAILKAYYELQDTFSFDIREIKWLESRINEIAVAFFLENKPIIIEKTGGYSGCTEEMTKVDNKFGTEVTILNFCYGCTDFSEHSANFIRIFNNRMEKLLTTNINK